MSHNIDPLDKNLTPPDPIRDQSDLSKLYKRHTKDAKNMKSAVSSKSLPEQPKGTITRDIRLFDTVFINFIIMVPYFLSFLSVAVILTLGNSPDLSTAFQNRVYSILLTLPALFPWIFAVRFLRIYITNYKITFTTFLFLYSLYILPVIDLSINLRDNNLPDYAILFATFTGSQLYLLFVAYLLNGRKILSLRTLPLFIFITILIFFAAIV